MSHPLFQPVSVELDIFQIASPLPLPSHPTSLMLSLCTNATVTGISSCLLSIQQSLLFGGILRVFLTYPFFPIWFYCFDHRSLPPISVPQAPYSLTILIGFLFMLPVFLCAHQTNANKHFIYKRKHTVYTVLHLVLFSPTSYILDIIPCQCVSLPGSFSQLHCVAVPLLV